jgi:hypothetical protein
LAALLLSGCGQGDKSGLPANKTQPSATRRAIHLIAGADAFIRINSCKGTPFKEASPVGSEAAFKFGDRVKLIKKFTPDDPKLPVFWLVQSGPDLAWLPAAYLAPSSEEVALLMKLGKVPKSFSFIYHRGEQDWVYGTFWIMSGVQGAPASDSGNDYAVEGNAVWIDQSVADQKPARKVPILIPHGTSSVKAEPGILYIFSSSGHTPSFDAIDTINLKEVP